MDNPAEQHPQRRLDSYRVLARLQAAGVPLAELPQRLAREGVDPAEARRLADRLIAKEAAERLRHRAAGLLRQGVGAKEVEDRLVAEGFDPDAAAAAVVAERHKDAGEGERTDADDWRWGLWTGGVVFALGVLLAIGNNTGLFPTFSFAGTITMGIGGLMVMVAYR